MSGERRHDEAEGASLEPRASVLVVDDDDANLLAIEAILEPLSLRVVLARSGLEALRRVLDEDFAVILMDVRMPDPDGIETAALIKQRPRSQGIPIIFLSAYDRDAAHLVRGYRQGAVDYLLKPCDPEILRAKVAVFTELYVEAEQQKRVEARRRLQERQALAKESEHRFRALTDAMPLSVWATGPDGEIIYENLRAKSLAREGWGLGAPSMATEPQRGEGAMHLGWSAFSGFDPGAGGTVWGLAPLHPDDRAAVRAAWEAGLRAGRPFELSCRFRRASDGAYRWHIARAVPERDSRGAITGWVATATDIDDQRRAEEALGDMLAREQEARREAETASSLKDEFLAVVSHELRTPLTAILGWARVLRAGDKAAANAPQALASIERNALAQARLVEDLLDVSRITTGKLSLDFRSMDLRTVALSAADTVRPAAEAKGVELELALEPVQGMAGDPDRVQQVFWNLIVNAVKFTPRGGRVTVSLREIGSVAELVVRDTGQGIAPSFLPHVFERFRQADGSTTRAHGGLGLGLSLVRHVVEMHGGSVRAESAGEGKGATFTVVLPRRAVAISAAATRPRGPVTSLAGLTVLVVDDEPDARDLIRAVLEGRGAEVLMAGSAAEALASLDDARVDVLLSDLGMPAEDGYALIRRVRARAPGAGGAVPAVALTAYAGADVGERARAAGFQMHVAKPVEPGRLAAVVAELAALAHDGLVGPASPPG